jgi:hypothetical protein
MPNRARWDPLRQAPRGRLAAPSIVGAAAATCAERVLRVLSSSKYRKGSLEQMDFARCRTPFLATILRCTRVGAPVQLTLMAFPFKVPNPAKVGSRTLPDLAELAAIRRCRVLAAAITDVYPPGLRLEIIHDGALIGDVFGVGLDEVRAYEAYFGWLVRAAAAEGVIRCHDFEEIQRGAGLDPSGSLGRLHDEARRWWCAMRGTGSWRASFQKTFGMLWLRDLPQPVAAKLLRGAGIGRLAPEHADVERRVHEAMVAYRVKNAIIHSFDPRATAFPNAIHVTTQVRPGRLALWLVRRGCSLLPWHSVAVVDGAGGVRLALADDVARQDLRGVLLPGEDAPFCYAPANGGPDLAALLPA